MDVLNRERAGFNGERQLKYPLSKLDLKFDHLHCVRLNYNSSFFQMDALLITPRFILIIEVKNYRDEVIFKEFDQVLHRDKVYQDPVSQVEEQKYQLEMWLQMNGFTQIPVETVVVMVNPRVLLKTSSENTIHQEKVVTLPRLASKIREISNQFPHEYLKISEMKQLGQLILDAHTDYIPDILKLYKINAHELMPGFICPQCGILGMKMYKKRLECPTCGLRSADAFMTALKDYFLLVGREITNGEFRRFTGVESTNTAKGMLTRADLTKKGKGRHTKYLLNFNYERDFDYLKNTDRIQKTTDRIQKNTDRK
ncbi:nuclease-related domain-containing protein [Tenuibacillus multivorans]|nr:nuclease-related domain-containing protein [Tenuibacillus multivorans]